MGESSRRSPTTARCYHDGMAGTEPLITIDPDIVGGEPVFAGTRVPVQILVDHLMAGDSIEVFLEDFPSVSREQALRFIAESADLLVERHGAPAA